MLVLRGMLITGTPGEIGECVFKDHIYKYRFAYFKYNLESGWYMNNEMALRHRFWDIQPGQVVADVGACFGSWTLPALAAGATVYAFEPHLQIYQELVYNASLNEFTELHPFNKAVWSTSGQILDLPQIDLSMMRRPNDNQPVMKVSTVSLDDALADLDRLDWIKIDIEGAEIEVLNGARQVIDKHNPRMIIEWHSDRNKDPELTYLKDFKVQQIDPGHYLVQQR